MHRHVYLSDIKSFFDNFPPLNKWISSKKTVPNIFDGAPTTFTSETAMYKWLCNRLNNSGQFKGMTFVVTAHKPDPSDRTKQPIECGMYISTSAPDDGWNTFGEESRPTIWSLQVLALGIECTLDASLDPFDEQTDDVQPVSQRRMSTLERLLANVELVFRFQKRLFHYTVIFFDYYARIIRFDRSGIVATEKIDYVVHGSCLTEFFLHYCHSMSPADRGHDPTAARIDPKGELAADIQNYGVNAAEKRPKDHVPPLFNKTLDEQWPWWKLKVYDEVTNSHHSFAVGKPHFYAGGVVGRGTCGYIAVPLDENGKPTPLRIPKDSKPTPLSEDDKPADGDQSTESKDVYFVYLKDAWRVDHAGIEKEGAVLHVLNKHQVHYVPTLLHYGDLGQDTLSYAKWAAYHDNEDPSDCPLKAHQHYRLVVAEVGKPLSEFTNGRELVIAILCCIIAHKEACQAGYIHRDISAGNILLYPNAAGAWTGLLNDWELSKAFEDGKTKEGNRQFDRTGTWQFTSVHALINYSRIIAIPDDLESFFHVMLYFAIRFLPHNASDVVGELLFNYFDDYTNGKRGQTSGSTKYTAMHDGQIDITRFTGSKIDENGASIEEFLTFLWPDDDPTSESTAEVNQHPIDLVISDLLQWFKALYTQDKKVVTKRPGPKNKPKGVLGDPTLALLGIESSKAPLISSTVLSQPTESERLAQLELAKKLDTHDAMVQVLTQYVSQLEWPDVDKGDDKKPKKGYSPPKDNIPATSTKIGSKRVLEDGAEPSSKRIRSKARA
ncbi:hypothetical protein LXA43DRAFT_1157857 [Ganoderma leucocontextum]|nr:hypothetical protein LXA43DRAFT_1157857 [Ganoderma leucocontextum]